MSKTYEQEYGHKPKGIITRRIDKLEARIDTLEHALLTVASWSDMHDWEGCLEYVNAMILQSDEKLKEPNDKP